MATARFTLTDADPSPFEVKWSWWGREQYFYDGRLLQSLWDLTTFSGNRTFAVGGHEVRISWAAKEDFLTRVHVDGLLRIDNLFPQLMLKRRPFSWASWLKTVAIWIVIGAIGGYGYKYWRARQHVTPNNTLQRSVEHLGRTVLAMDCVLAGAQWQRRPAAELDR